MTAINELKVSVDSLSSTLNMVIRSYDFEKKLSYDSQLYLDGLVWELLRIQNNIAEIASYV